MLHIVVGRDGARDLRQLLWHRHRLVQMRTRIMNQLQALAIALLAGGGRPGGYTPQPALAAESRCALNFKYAELFQGS